MKRSLFAALPAILPLMSTAPAARAQPAQPIREVWRRPMESAQCLAVSPDGSRCALVAWNGEVSCWASGRLSWRRRVPGAQQVLLAADGHSVVYTPLDGRRRDLLALGQHGAVVRRFTAGGPITAVAIAPDSRTVAVGTAGGAVELEPLVGRDPARRVVLHGAVQQLCYDDSGGLVVTTAAPAWLASLAPTGQVRWHRRAPAGSEFRIGMPPRGARAAGLTVAAVVPAVEAEGDRSSEEDEPGSTQTLAPPHIEIVAFASGGKPVWRRQLSGRDPHLGMMTASGCVVVAYERADRRGLVLRYDRSLICFGEGGAPRWQHGDMVYAPLLVCASPQGDAVLSLCSGNRFWLLSGRGQILWSYTTTAPIRMARASADGSTVVVATSDNQLALLKITLKGR